MIFASLHPETAVFLEVQSEIGARVCPSCAWFRRDITLDSMAFQLFSHADPFACDASERVHAADVAIARSIQSLAISRAYFAISQLKISRSKALISAADRLILVLEREMISRPDSAGAASNADCLQEN